MLCLLVGLSVSAQQRQRANAEERAQRETETMKKELNLTEVQIHKVDSISLVYAKKIDEVMASGDREKMRAAFESNTEEKEKAYKAILTDVQYKKFKELEQTRPQGPGQRQGPRPRTRQ